MVFFSLLLLSMSMSFMVLSKSIDRFVVLIRLKKKEKRLGSAANMFFNSFFFIHFACWIYIVQSHIVIGMKILHLILLHNYRNHKYLCLLLWLFFLFLNAFKEGISIPSREKKNDPFVKNTHRKTETKGIGNLWTEIMRSEI